LVTVPTSIFVSTISVGNVYYFIHPTVSKEIPHYFIVTSKTEDVIYLACCTTQAGKRQRHYRLTGIPLSCLVWIKPDEYNGLKTDSYIDSTCYFAVPIDFFTQLYLRSNIEYKGKVSNGHLSQIYEGIKQSQTIETEIIDIILKDNIFGL
jgi:hypothetical protein